MKRWIIVSTVVVTVAAALFFVRQNQLRAEQAPKTVPVTRGTVAQEALAVGSIVPEQEISVKSKIPGIVAKVHVAVGDPVKAGDPLIDIRPDPTPLERAEAQRQFEMARVTEEAAKKELDRAEDLSAKGLLSDAGAGDDPARLRLRPPAIAARGRAAAASQGRTGASRGSGGQQPDQSHPSTGRSSPARCIPAIRSFP